MNGFFQRIEQTEARFQQTEAVKKQSNPGDWVDYGWCTNTVDAVEGHGPSVPMN